MEDVYEKSPNRSGEPRVRTLQEEIMNYVEKIPEINLKMEGDSKFVLRTQKYGRVNDSSMREELQNDLDGIVRLVKDTMKAKGFDMTIEHEDTNLNIMGWNSYRQGLYVIESIYTFTFKDKLGESRIYGARGYRNTFSNVYVYGYNDFTKQRTKKPVSKLKVESEDITVNGGTKYVEYLGEYHRLKGIKNKDHTYYIEVSDSLL